MVTAVSALCSFVFRNFGPGLFPPALKVQCYIDTNSIVLVLKVSGFIIASCRVVAIHWCSLSTFKHFEITVESLL